MLSLFIAQLLLLYAHTAAIYVYGGSTFRGGTADFKLHALPLRS